MFLVIEGLAEAKNTYTLRNVPDLDEIMAALDKHPKEAVVIGAGFIGLEWLKPGKTWIAGYYRGESTSCLATIRSRNGSLCPNRIG